MGHALVPKTGRQHSAQEIAERLRREFACIAIDAEAGAAAAARAADWLESRLDALFVDAPERRERARQRVALLRSLASGDALQIAFGDTWDTARSITVFPDEPIRFGYGGDEDEAAARATVERCARALECDLVLF
jgi:hypothetical protein